ncbi:metallophosphoesterase [Listeria sp. PSOL-1]|uniref:metallophosphoesterase n=1 Tax=Listeria sp. PSOL-1 TaxID=1844999 RepID=UPI0013D28AF9|nr:metallophosphoesterase [Listeria sp. PSOL-1]
MSKRWMTLAGSLAAIAGYAYYSTKKLQITEYEVSSTKIPIEWKGKKFIQLSDLHSSKFGRANHKLLEIVKRVEPTGIFLTGDLLDGDEWIDVAISLVRKLVKICPVFYINGNHEQRSAFYEELLIFLKQAGVTILENEHCLLEAEGETIVVAGVTDPSFALEELEGEELTKSEKFKLGLEVLKENIISATKNIREDQFTILLSHRPEFWALYQTMPVDLILAGHAHGGQIRLPFTEGLFAPGQGFFPKITAGSHQQNGRELIVSRGLGNSVFFVPRVLNNPEVVVLTLKNNSK